VVEGGFSRTLTLLVEPSEGNAVMVDDARLLEAGVVICGGGEGIIGVLEGGGGVDFKSSEDPVGEGGIGGNGEGVLGTEADAFEFLLVVAPGAVAVLFPFGNVLVGEAGMANVREVFGYLLEGDAFGDPLGDLMADGGREMSDFAPWRTVCCGIAEIQRTGGCSLVSRIYDFRLTIDAVFQITGILSEVDRCWVFGERVVRRG